MLPGAAFLVNPSMSRITIKRRELKRDMRDGMERRWSGKRVVGATMKNPTIFHPSDEKWPKSASSESPRRTIQAMAKANNSQQKLASRFPILMSHLSQRKKRSNRTHRTSTQSLAFQPKALIPRSLYPWQSGSAMMIPANSFALFHPKGQVQFSTRSHTVMKATHV